MCFAAYAMLWTGLGLSVVAATYLRWGVIVLCVTSLSFLIISRASMFR